VNFNTEEEKAALLASLSNTNDLSQTIYCLEKVLEYRTPFALYVATADRSDCTWIFDEEMVYSMLGGEDRYIKVRKDMFPTPLEEESGVVFFVFKKVGPFYSIRVDLALIEEILDELTQER